MRTRTRVALGGVVGALALVGAAAVATAAVGVLVARRVIIPPSRREESSVWIRASASLTTGCSTWVVTTASTATAR